MPKTPKPSSSARRRRPSKADRVLRSMLKSAVAYSLVLGASLTVAGLWLGPVRDPDALWPVSLIAVLAFLGIALANDKVLKSQRRARVQRPWEFTAMLTGSLLLSAAQAFAVLFLDYGPALPLFLLPLVCLLTSLLGLAILASLRNRYRVAVALAPAVAVTVLLTGVWWVMAEQERQRTREEIIRALDDPPLPVAVLDSPDWEPSNVSIEDGVLLAATIDYVPVDPSSELEEFSLTLRVSPVRPEVETGWEPRYKGCPTEGGAAECEEYGDVVIATSGVGDAISSLQARVEVVDGTLATLTTNRWGHQGTSTTDFPDIDMVELSERIRPAEPEDAEEIAMAITD